MHSNKSSKTIFKVQQNDDLLIYYLNINIYNLKFLQFHQQNKKNLFGENVETLNLIFFI